MQVCKKHHFLSGVEIKPECNDSVTEGPHVLLDTPPPHPPPRNPRGNEIGLETFQPVRRGTLS